MLERTRSSPGLRYSSASRKVFTGMMSSPWTWILLFQAILSSALGYKLPFMDQSIPTDHDNTLLGKDDHFSSVSEYQWGTEDRADKESPTLIRLIREISEKMKGDSGPDEKSPVKVDDVSKSPLEKSPDVKNPVKEETVSKSPPEISSGVKNPSKVEMVSKSPLEKSPPEISPGVKNPSKVEMVSKSSLEKSPPKISPAVKNPSKVEMVSKSPLEKSPPEISPAVKTPSKVDMVSKSPLEKSPPEISPGVKNPSKVEMVSKSPVEMSSDAKYPLKVETISKSLLETSPDVTPKIILPSKVKVQTMALLSEMETTTVSKLDHITTVQGKLKEAETTHIDKTMTEAMKTTGLEDLKLVTQGKPFISSSTKSEDLSVVTKAKADKATHSIDDKHLSSIPASTSATVVKYTSLVVPSQRPSDTPSKPPGTSANPTLIHAKTTQRISDLSGTTPAMVTHVSTEDKIHIQSLMKQCMLTILILAVVCTIFIITTIALAAKISSMKQKQKLRHPATYTEMRCISSLLPESDQQSKLKPKRLKTFAAAMEESDGDNTTLNSFLPDH